MSVDRTRLDAERLRVTERVLAARATLAAAEAEARVVDEELAGADVGEDDPLLVRAVVLLRVALVETGHPVLDVLVTARSSREGALVRVEFGYDGRRVAVLRARAYASDLVVAHDSAASTASGLPTPREARVERRELRENLADLAPGHPGPGPWHRSRAANDDVRAVLRSSEAARRSADAVVTARYLAGREEGETLSAVRSLLSGEEEGTYGTVATRADAERTLVLLADVAAGTPLEWADRRFGGEGS